MSGLVSLFGPAIPADTDTAAVTLGLRFTPKTAGAVVGMSFWVSPANRGPHVGTLWSGSRRLASVTFPATGGTGWHEAIFDRPVEVVAGREYVVSYRAPYGRYAATNNAFTRPVSSEHLTAPTAAGVYTYGDGPPTQSWKDSSYFVDVLFAAGATTPAPDPEPDPDPPTGVLDGLPRVPWHGGPDYYRQFPKALEAGWADPGFFPIAVFFGKPSHARALKAVGVNTYMGAEHDGSPITMITREGISISAQGEWTRAEVGDNPLVVSWHISDECDMGYSGCTPDWDNDNGEYGRLDIHRGYAASFRRFNDGRFLHANFGNGVLGTWWAPNTMDGHLDIIDVSSVDKYAYTSPHVQEIIPVSRHWPAGKNPKSAGTYGWLQDRMETFTTPPGSKPNWVFVETAMPYLTEPGATTITGDQIEGAVWNAIIHGASGIAYFQHNNNGRCGNYSLVDCSQQLKDKVTQVNGQVRGLAPVLNTQTRAWRFGDGLDTALKVHGGNAYIVAMTDGGAGARTFTLPAGISGTVVEVVDENRTIPVSSGRFTDSFTAEHDHHIYRITI